MYLGIDLGTSGVKAIIIDDAGRVAGQGTAGLKVSRPHPLWSEQSPQDWWQATGDAVKAIAPDLRAKITGIGIAGQMHGATLLGADDAVLRPAILWNDGRCEAECAALEKTVPDSRAITGNLAMPGFTAPKLEWVRGHEPEIFAKVRSVLLPKDYLRLRMTGEKASDMSDSAGTFWLDVAKRDWSDAMLEATGLTRDHMPRLVEGPEITGTLRSDIANDWGMGKVPVIAGGGDNAAGAAGVGMMAEGDALLSLGTSGVIFVATKQFRPNPGGAVHAFCHCLPDTWHQMSVHLSAASCADWAANIMGLDVADFFAKAEQGEPGDGPELFLPYLSGERTPHNDPTPRGSFLNMSHASDPTRLANAVLEGVAFAHADGLRALQETGTTISALTVIGGGARSAHWGQILAAALDVRLDYREGGEVGPALGAARLAMMGVSGVSAADACPKPPLTHAIEPDPELTDRLSSKYAQFRAAYPSLAQI